MLGWLLKHSGWVIPLLIMHRVLATAWLRAALGSWFGKTTELVLTLIRCTELFLPLALVAGLAFLECLRLKFLHYVAVFPRVGRQSFHRGVMRAGALKYLVVVARLLAAVTPLLLVLIAVVSIGVGDEVRGSFLLPSLAVSIMIMVGTSLKPGVILG